MLAARTVRRATRRGPSAHTCRRRSVCSARPPFLRWSATRSSRVLLAVSARPRARRSSGYGPTSKQNQLFSIVGSILFTIGLWLMRTKFLGASWRLVTAITLILTNIIDMPFTFLTIYNVVRNQYFFLEDGLITSIPAAMGCVVSTYVMVEIAEPGTEGVTYGILTTASNIGGPVNSAISNWIFGYWQPSLSDSNNYVAARGGDTAFRNSVAMSFVLSYAFALPRSSSCPCPRPEGGRRREASRPRHYGFALAAVGLIGVALVFSLTVSTDYTRYSCLEIAAGTDATIESGFDGFNPTFILHVPRLADDPEALFIQSTH